MLVFSFNMGLYLSPLTILRLHENPTIANRAIEKRLERLYMTRLAESYYYTRINCTKRECERERTLTIFGIRAEG